MIAPLLLAAAVAAPCPAGGVDAANARLLAGGGTPARLCLAEAYAEAGRWAAAAEAWEAAARESDRSDAAGAARARIAAANAWTQADRPARTRAVLDAALASPALAGADRGEALLDRAYAHVALGDPVRARADVDAALGLVAAKAPALHLSALLAVNEGQDDRARRDIAEAQRLDGSPALAAEAARIAAALAGKAS